MDPPLISEGSFSTANPSFTEIWPLNGAGVPGGMLGLRIGRDDGFGIDGFVNDSGGVGGVVGVVNRDGSVAESTVTEQSGSFSCGGDGGWKRRKNVSEDEYSKMVSTTSGNDLESNGKRMKLSGSKDENSSSKAGSGTSSAKGSKPSEKPTEPLKDYIPVRARRGQATDSHSLAERARREKISGRMKILQDLVPGCNKVIGKALVLDEIINYVQSLQRQVEFLSVKLEAVNSGLIPLIDGFCFKELNHPGIPSFDASGMLFGAQVTREFAAAAGPQANWLHMQVGGSYVRTS